MKICTNHRNQNIEEVRAIVNEIRDAGNCPCCGFKYHTSKNSYFSSESPPLSWKKHDNCCSFSVLRAAINNLAPLPASNLASLEPMPPVAPTSSIFFPFNDSIVKMFASSNKAAINLFTQYY